MKKYEHLNEAEIANIVNDLPSDRTFIEVSNLFKVFGDNTRVKILFILLKRKLCVHEISLALNMSQSATSHQLRRLRDANLVKFTKKGKEVIYSLDDKCVKQILEIGLQHINEKQHLWLLIMKVKGAN